MIEIPDLLPPSSRRHGIMLAQPFDERRLAKWNPPYIIQPKLDGQRCRAWIGETGTVLLISSEENTIFDYPHINQALARTGLRNVELDGELYTHGMSFESIMTHANAEDVEYHIFDIVTSDPQHARTMQLVGMSTLFKRPLHLVGWAIAENLDQIMVEYDRIIKEGYEGIIIRQVDAPYERKRSLWVMKFKPKKSDIYQILGWKEEVSQSGMPKGRLGSLICRGNDIHSFDVGTGYSADQRAALWEGRHILPGMYVHVKYQAITPGKGVPRFPVFVEILEKGEIA